MSLAVGLRLGPYEIDGPLGAGGMGEVYRARDTRLGRMVAIKTLPDRLAQDSHALARFECEPTSSFIRAYSVFPLYMSHRYDKAIVDLKALIEAEPKQTLSYPFLGLAYEQKGKYDEAIAAFQMTLELEPTNLEGKAQLGHAYGIAGKKDAAL
jgi:tetratricopeptide (TPR) repeat protein